MAAWGGSSNAYSAESSTQLRTESVFLNWRIGCWDPSSLRLLTDLTAPVAEV